MTITPSQRTTASRLRAAALAFAVAGLGACTATWKPAVVAAPPGPALQWPFAPAPARLTWDRALTGFARERDAGSVVASVLRGGDPSAGAFVQPVALALADDGRVAVADPGCRCVHLYRPSDASYRRLDGAGDLRLASPVSVTFDDRGTLWVSDSVGLLYAFDADGRARTPLRRVGPHDLSRPTGLAWSRAAARLYVVDTLADAVRVLDHDGAFVASFGRRGAGDGELNRPTHVAVSPAGEVYVSDALNFRIAIFDGDGRSRGGFGRHGDGTGDFAMPKGVAVDADGIVYVADAVFDVVQLFDRDGRYLLTLGSRGAGPGQFWLPSGVVVGPGGDLHVCDAYNRRIQVFHRTEEGRATPAS